MKKVNLCVYNNADGSFKTYPNSILIYSTPDGDGAIKNTRAYVEVNVSKDSAPRVKSIEVDIYPNKVYQDAHEYKIWTSEERPINDIKNDILEYINEECSKEIYKAKAQMIIYAMKRDLAKNKLGSDSK